jgi:hypothetical protein
MGYSNGIDFLNNFFNAKVLLSTQAWEKPGFWGFLLKIQF